VLAGADHFAHRENGGIVVDLFWWRDLRDEFRVEVEDDREGTRFVLHPRTGREAIQAFYHPFAATRAAVNGKRRAASWSTGDALLSPSAPLVRGGDEST
jgi:hypothetical protein